MMTVEHNSYRLPLEILERVAYFAGGYVMCILGINPYSTCLARNGMFLSGGPGVALDQIFLHGGDPRALLTVYGMREGVIPADLAITKAVATRSPKILARVFAIWGTTESDTGVYMSMVDDFRFGVDNITCSPDSYRYIVPHRNMYYLNRGVYDRIREDVDKLYASTGDVDHGLPVTEEAYEKMYPHASPYWKINMAVKMRRMEDIYHLQDMGLASLDHSGCTMESLSVEELIGLYNRCNSEEDDGGYYEENPGDIMVALCGRISTLDELDGILNKNSPGYIQAIRYFLGTPGYIHPRFTGIAIDTHKDTILDNIIGVMHVGDEDGCMHIIHEMEIRKWSLDMIMGRFRGTWVTMQVVMKYMNKDRAELFKEGLVSLDDLLLTGTTMIGSLRGLDHGIIRDIIHRARKICIGSVDELLWIWRDFGGEMTVGSQGGPYLCISQGIWSYSAVYGSAFRGSHTEILQRRIDVYMCWNAYNV